MGADLHLNPPPPPDPLEQIARRLEWQKQEIERLATLTVTQALEIKRLEQIILERKPGDSGPGSTHALRRVAT